MWAKWTKRMQRLKCVGEAGLQGGLKGEIQLQRTDLKGDSPDDVPYTFQTNCWQIRLLQILQKQTAASHVPWPRCIVEAKSISPSSRSIERLRQIVKHSWCPLLLCQHGALGPIPLALIRVIHYKGKLAHHRTLFLMATDFTLKTSTTVTMVAWSSANSFNQTSSLVLWCLWNGPLLLHRKVSSKIIDACPQQLDWGTLAASTERDSLCGYEKVEVTGSHNPAQPGRVSGHIQGRPHEASAPTTKHIFQ